MFKQLCRFHIPSVLCAAAILVLCVIKLPEHQNPDPIPYFDKIVHFTMFFTFSFVYLLENWYVTEKKAYKPLRYYIRALLLSGLFGAIIEGVQGVFTSYRSADIYDWYFDVLGAGLAIALVALAGGLRAVLTGSKR